MSFRISRRPVKQEYYEEEEYEQTGIFWNSPVFWYHSFSSSWEFGGPIMIKSNTVNVVSNNNLLSKVVFWWAFY